MNISCGNAGPITQPCRIVRDVVNCSPIHVSRKAAVRGGELLTHDLEKVLRKHARFISAGEDIDPDMPLASLGVQSLDIIELIVKIEDEFDLDIPAERITPETFATPASIWRLLCQIDPTLAERQLS